MARQHRDPLWLGNTATPFGTRHSPIIHSTALSAVMHSCLGACVHACMVVRGCMRAWIRAGFACVHVCICACTHLRMCVCVHAYVRTCVDALLRLPRGSWHTRCLLARYQSSIIDNVVSLNRSPCLTEASFTAFAFDVALVGAMLSSIYLSAWRWQPSAEGRVHGSIVCSAC